MKIVLDNDEHGKPYIADLKWCGRYTGRSPQSFRRHFIETGLVSSFLIGQKRFVRVEQLEEVIREYERAAKEGT